MKKSYNFINLVLFSIIIILASFRSMAQWQEQTSPVTVPLYTVSVVNNSVAWIGGQQGTVLRTTDGGATWVNVGGVAISNNVYNIFGVDEQTALCSAPNISPSGGAYVFKTTDGGNTWNLVYTKTGGRIHSIWMNNAFDGFMYGSPINSAWELYNTVDGGNNWTLATVLIENGSEFGHNNAMYVSGSNIYFGTSNSTIYNSNNLGSNWTLETTTQANSYSIWFNDASNGLMGGETALNRTTDGGINWNELTTLQGSGTIVAITGLNNQWWATRQTKIYNSVDNGDSWSSQYTSPTSGVFNAMSKARNGDLIIAVREDGGISAYNITVPVELTSFTASTNNSGQVVLSWTTATETNNSGFQIERSDNSKIENSDNWERIGFVEGNGTSTLTHKYSYVDKNVSVGKHFYRLKQTDFDGSYEYFKKVEVEVTAPKEFSLDQNYPNPFNPDTRIKFSLAIDSKVSLKIFNVLGQEVATLINEDLAVGVHNINFDASGFKSGIYFYRIEADGINGNEFVDVKRMVLLK